MDNCRAFSQSSFLWFCVQYFCNLLYLILRYMDLWIVINFNTVHKPKFWIIAHPLFTVYTKCRVRRRTATYACMRRLQYVLQNTPSTIRPPQYALHNLPYRYILPHTEFQVVLLCTSFTLRTPSHSISLPLTPSHSIPLPLTPSHSLSLPLTSTPILIAFITRRRLFNATDHQLPSLPAHILSHVSSSNRHHVRLPKMIQSQQTTRMNTRTPLYPASSSPSPSRWALVSLCWSPKWFRCLEIAAMAILWSTEMVSLSGTVMLELILELTLSLQLEWALAHDVLVEVAGGDSPQLHFEYGWDAIVVLHGQMLESPCSILSIDSQT